MIILIDNDGSFTYNMYQTLVGVYASVEVIHHKRMKVDEIIRLNPLAVILTAGPGRPQDYPEMTKLIQEIAHDIPLLGVSLGHWAIAEAFGAQLEPVKSFEHGKATDILHQGQDLFAQLPNPVKGGCFHAFTVSKDHFPPDLAILAESREGAMMCLRHRLLPVFGVQFYPESVLTPRGGDLLNNFVKIANQWRDHGRGKTVS